MSLQRSVPLGLPRRGSAPRLAAFALAVVAAGLAADRACAEPLPRDSVEDLRRLLKREHLPSMDAAEETAALVEHRKRLDAAIRKLPSLGDMARALLLTEWGIYESFGEPLLESDKPPMPLDLDQIDRIAEQRDLDSFRKELRNALDLNKDTRERGGKFFFEAINRNAQRELLRRFREGLQSYLGRGRPAERIAAANMVRETMTNARKQSIVQEPLGGAMVDQMPMPKPGGKKSRMPTSQARQLRDTLGGMLGDLEHLTNDPDPQVQAAAARALGSLEANPALTVPVLDKLLQSNRDVLARQAAAEALGELIEIAIKMGEERPGPMLIAMEWVFPAAARGLRDENEEVRRLCVAACRKVADQLEDMVTIRPGASAEDTADLVRGITRLLPRLRPLKTAVENSLPSLNEGARDRVPEIRVDVCHVLEKLAVVRQQLTRLQGPRTPAPLPLPSPDNGKERPPAKGAHRPAGRSPSQWAVTRLPAAPAPFREEAARPMVTLDRPRKVAEEGQRSVAERPGEGAVRPVAYLAPPDALPAPNKVNAGPKKVELALEGTVESMIDGLRDSDYRVRLASIDVLETFGDRAVPAIDALTRTVLDPNLFVRWASARTLGKLAHTGKANKAVPVIMRLLNDREDLSVRIAAAVALEQFGPAAKEAVPLLGRVINRGDRTYRIAIMHTIQGIGTDAKDALPSVAWILINDDNASVRTEAANTLGLFGELARGQLRWLRYAMEHDSNNDVRQAASNAVLTVGAKPAP